MKKIIIYLTFIMISSIYTQCDDYNLLQCNNDNNCEWFANIQYENCDEIGGGISDCQQIEGCEWDCDSWYTWLCGCEGQYQVDFSYCTEIQSSECAGINQSDCINNQFCNWIENIEYGYCNEFDQNANACEATPGCYGAYQYPGWYSGWYCAGGTYQITNSYCEETPYELGDINQDDIINVMDIISVVNLILNDSYEEIADLNQDQFLNVIDLLLIIDIILNN
tara:strand:+ start:113 stop:781 length:669 start_codon:yes stop_codon:yes gene_type:complete